MPKVFNWQIGREMEYPYERAVPDRQFSAVFDLNKCIACQTCTLACKGTWTAGRGQEYMFWNNVETKPYGGYPRGWETRLLEMIGGGEWQDGVYEGETIFEAAPEGDEVLGFMPDDEDWAHPNMGEDDVAGGSVPQGAHYTIPHDIWHFYLPRICNHCTYPACLASCPRQAIYKREEDGIVLVDQERCRGYRECNKACPYGKVMYNPVTRVSEKCIGCFPAVEEGRQPQCTINCIGRVRMNGWIHDPENADPENLVDYLVHHRKMALPLYPQFGLQMNIYYIPPIHVPTEYLGQMFGPGVEEAREQYRQVMDDPELLGALLLFGTTDQWISRFRVANDWAYGYDEHGEELVRVPLEEPEHIRPLFDADQEVYRHNIP